MVCAVARRVPRSTPRRCGRPEESLFLGGAPSCSAAQRRFFADSGPLFRPENALPFAKFSLGFLWIFPDLHGFGWISMGSLGFPWVWLAGRAVNFLISYRNSLLRHILR